MSKISNEAAANIRLEAKATLAVADEMVSIGEHGQAQRLELVAEDLKLAASLLLECRKAERAARRADAERVILTFKVGELADGPTQEDHDAVQAVQDIADVVVELKDWEKELLGLAAEPVTITAEGPTYVPVEDTQELSTGDKVRVLESGYTESTGVVGVTGTVDRDSNTSYARVKLDRELGDSGSRVAHLVAEELEKLVEPAAAPKEPVYVPVKDRSELSNGDRVRLNDNFPALLDTLGKLRGSTGKVNHLSDVTGYGTLVFDDQQDGFQTLRVRATELDKLVEEN